MYSPVAKFSFISMCRETAWCIMPEDRSLLENVLTGSTGRTLSTTFSTDGHRPLRERIEVTALVYVSVQRVLCTWLYCLHSGGSLKLHLLERQSGGINIATMRAPRSRRVRIRADAGGHTSTRPSIDLYNPCSPL